MAGGVITGTDFIEWDGANGALISGDGIERRSDGMLVYEQSSGQISLSLAEDKITGSTLVFRGKVKAAYGVAASLSGKSFTATAKSTGPGPYEVEEVFE